MFSNHRGILELGIATASSLRSDLAIAEELPKPEKKELLIGDITQRHAIDYLFCFGDFIHVVPIVSLGLVGEPS